MKKRIGEMEEAALATKGWQLAGEVQAAARPVDALLQEDLEFEQQTRTGSKLPLKDPIKL